MIHEEPGAFSPGGLARITKMAEIALPEKLVVSHIVESRFIEIWRRDAGYKITWGREILYKVAGFRGIGDEAYHGWRGWRESWDELRLSALSSQLKA